MLSRLVLRCVVLPALCFLSSPLPAQETAPIAAPLLKVTGESPSPLKLSLPDLQALAPAEARVKDRDGEESVYAGTPVSETLRAAGMTFDPAKMPTRGSSAWYLVIEGGDGYKAVFALSEIDPTQSSSTVLLAWKKDGADLPTNEAALRIIAPADKRPIRWVRQVSSIALRKE